MKNPNNVIYGLYHKDDPEVIRYVGQTVRNFSARWSSHKHASYVSSFTGGYDYNVPVHNWMRKHPGNIGYRFLEILADAQGLDEAEVKWIMHYRTLGQADLNLNDGGGGNSGWKHSDQSRAKMKARVYTEETRQKMSDSARARTDRAEVGEKLSKKIAEFGNPNALLTKDQVLDIKVRLWNGESVKPIADLYGVKVSVVSHISAGHSWTHVPWPIGPRREPQTRQLLSDAGAGRVHSVQTRKKLGTAISDSWTPERIEDWGRRVSGEGNAASKLTADDVRAIRKRRDSTGESYAKIGKDYGVGSENISKICRRLSWANVE